MSRANVFTINLDKDNVIDFEELILRKESEELAARRKELSKSLHSAFNKSLRNSLCFTLFSLIAAIIGVFCLAMTLLEYVDSGTLPLVFLLPALIFLGVAAVLYAIRRKRDKNSEGELDDNMKVVDDAYGEHNELVKRELGVPEDARDVEIFTNMYFEKDSEHDGVYSNVEVKVFEEEGNLCFWYGEAIIGFPISRLEGVVRVSEPITFDSWLEDIPYDRGNYMQYKIKKNEANELNEYEESYSMTGYYSVRFTQLDTSFEIIVPLYDIDPILEILNTEPVEE